MTRGAGRDTPTGRPVAERFWEKVDTSGDCWIWTAYKRSSGHGRFWANGRLGEPHRFSYELTHGSIPEGMVVDHMCHTPQCVRPDHLQAVTQGQNVQNKIGASSNSKTGILGVSPCVQTGKFRVTVQGKHVGRYDTVEEAEAVAIAARNKVFTNNLVDRQLAINWAEGRAVTS